MTNNIIQTKGFKKDESGGCHHHPTFKDVLDHYGKGWVIDMLRTSKNKFAKDIIVEFEKWGRLSNNKWDWAISLALPETNGWHQDGFTGLYSFMKEAKKTPNLTIPMGKAELHLKMVGDVVSIVSVYNYQADWRKTPKKFYTKAGYIYSDGKWYKPKLSGSIEGVIVSLNRDPGEYIKEQGKLFGRCCLCGSQLSVDESLEAGVGPTCAANYGINYGEEKVNVECK